MKIENNIPIPAPHQQGVKYPFGELGVGDSFLAPPTKCQSLKAAASQYKRLHGVNFTTRIVEDGVRIWRIE